MKYYIIAGEASGDLHGSNLMKELKVLDTRAEFRYFGGDQMQNEGGTLIKHYREMAFMGFLSVILNIRTIKKNMELCKKDILHYKPDVLILIDYPGFNLRMAEFAKENNLRVFYYISPKLWAWKEYRVKKIKEFVDELFTILPFETDFYKKHSVDVHYVGNPTLDAIESFRENALSEREFRKKNNLDTRPIVALLAGSRIHEIKRILPTMVKSTEGKSGFQFVLGSISSIEKTVYQEIIGNSPIKLLTDQTYDLLNNARAALVASGTAALETAFFEVPQVVLYKVEGGRLMNFVGWTFLIKTKWVSLPNIILQEELVQELIQVNMTPENVQKELEKLLYNSEYINKIKHGYKRLIATMGKPGCSKRAAEKMIALLTK